MCERLKGDEQMPVKHQQQGHASEQEAQDAENARHLAVIENAAAESAALKPALKEIFAREIPILERKLADPPADPIEAARLRAELDNLLQLQAEVEQEELEQTPAG